MKYLIVNVEIGLRSGDLNIISGVNDEVIEIISEIDYILKSRCHYYFCRKLTCHRFQVYNSLQDPPSSPLLLKDLDQEPYPYMSDPSFTRTSEVQFNFLFPP